MVSEWETPLFDIVEKNQTQPVSVWHNSTITSVR